MVNDNAGLQSPIAIANSPRSQEAKKPRSSLVPLGRQAKSVTREPRSGPAWSWWREVNPIDGEVCAQPWTNTGMIDRDLAGERPYGTGVGDRHRCSGCDVTWQGASRCFACGEIADDVWPERQRFGHNDGFRRHVGGMQ